MEFFVVGKNIFRWVARFSLSFTFLFLIIGTLNPANVEGFAGFLMVSFFSIILSFITFFIAKIRFPLERVFAVLMILCFIPIGLSIATQKVGGGAEMGLIPFVFGVFLFFNFTFGLLAYKKELWGGIFTIYGLGFFASDVFRLLVTNPESRTYATSFYSYGLYFLTGVLFLLAYFFNKNNKIFFSIFIISLLFGIGFFIIYGKLYYSIMTDQTFESGWNLHYLGQDLTDSHVEIYNAYTAFRNCDSKNNECRFNSLEDCKNNLVDYQNLIEDYKKEYKNAKVSEQIAEYNINMMVRNHDFYKKLYEDYLFIIYQTYYQHSSALASLDDAKKNNNDSLIIEYWTQTKDLAIKEKNLWEEMDNFIDKNKSNIASGYNSINCSLNECDINKLQELNLNHDK